VISSGRVVLVTGGRKYADRVAVFRHLDELHRAGRIALIVEGGATGADRFAREWGDARGVPVATFRAPWSALGKPAGPIRNRGGANHGTEAR
jgi:hypothetical protein